MTQITGAGFSNFRVFKSGTFFDFSPISIFTGTNNSGKSSIFKALLLLADNAKYIDGLDFTGQSHKLGSFSYAKNKTSSKDSIQFSLRIEDDHISLFPNGLITFLDYKQPSGSSEKGYITNLFIALGKEVKSKFESEEILLSLYESSEQDSVIDFNFKYMIGRVYKHLLPGYLDYIRTKESRREDGNNSSRRTLYVNDFSPYSEYDEILKQLSIYDQSIIQVDKVRSILHSFPESSIEQFINEIENWVLQNLSKSKISIDYNFSYDTGPYVQYLTQMIEEHANVLSQRSTVFSKFSEVDVIDLLDEELDLNIFPYLKDIKVYELINPSILLVCKQVIAIELTRIWKSLTGELSKINNIEGVRANSQRLYTNQSQGTAFNELLVNASQGWSYYSGLVNDKSTDKSFLRKWISKFGIGEDIEINRVKGIATEVYVIRDGEKLDLIDLGYGVTQFLPILISIITKCPAKEKNDEWKWLLKNDIIRKTNGPILLIEEPESNLHPKLQSLLADFFIDVAKHFEVTLLIETHSEYFIRRLQVLTASDKVKPEDSVIYYLDGNVSSESDKFVKKININLDGSLTNDFGPGFIDEATNWKLELMRLKNAHLYNVN